MKCKKEKIMECISFLLNDTTRPGVVLDLEGTILYVNNSFREEFGIEEAENIQKVITEQSMDQWNEIMCRVDGTGSKTQDVSMRLVQNRIGDVKVHLMYLGDARQVLALFDIPQSTTDVAEKTYIQAFRNSDSFMIVIDQEGTIYDVNDMHTEFFDLPKDYFIGKSAEKILNFFPEDLEAFSNYMKDLSIYGYAEITTRYELAADDIKYYHIITFYDGDTQTYFIRMDDRTEKVILEERLAHTGSLSTVGELAASIAHEIRNPMTTLKGFVQLLKLSATDDAMKYLAVIDDEVARMESILSEMLVLSKPAMNKKTTFSLEVLVADMIQVVYPKALMEGITILNKDNVLQDTLMVGDTDKIKQVLLNLFKNAFEAMAPGGVLTTSITEDQNGQLVLLVSDTGKGMNKNQLTQVFMPFFSSKLEGTGLGLPFVLKTVEEHGGAISVESELDKGTTFIVTFPMAIAHVSEETSDENRMLSS